MKAERSPITWEHPYAELTEALQRRPCAWLETLQLSAAQADPLLVARIPAVYRKLGAAGVPHVLPFFGLERDGDRLVLVHRHEEGESLAHRLDQGRLTVTRTLAILRAICRCLAAAHRVDVLHRALGPASVLLGRRGDDELWITDFALAELTSGSEAPVDETAVDEIDAPDVALRPMTPERARGEEGGPTEDVYLVGCLAYWMLAGVPPFAACDTAELAERHVDELPRSLAELTTEPVPFTLLDVVARALQKHPVDRFPDIESLDRALAQAQLEAGVAERAAAPRVPTIAPRQTNPFGTDPPRPRPRSLELQLERLPATMLITPEDRAELPDAPIAVDREVTATLPLPAVGPRRKELLAVVLGAIVLALAIWAIPVRRDQDVRTSGMIAAPRTETPAPAVVVDEVRTPVVEPALPVAPPLAPSQAEEPTPAEAPTPVEVPGPAEAPTPVAVPTPAAASTPAVAPAPEPAPAKPAAAPTPEPTVHARTTAAPVVAKAPPASKPAAVAEHETQACARVRKIADDAREGYDWTGLLRAASRPACWAVRSDAHALRVKALMELGAFSECATAVERMGATKGELARIGELCRRRAAAG